MNNKIAMLILMLSMYYLSYFYRVSTAVIAPDLVKNFAISAEKLGLLSSFYFYTFAFAQFIIGPLLDKYGARRIVAYFGIIAFTGAIIFAAAPSFEYAVLGRGLIGLGVSCAYMGALKFISIWYQPNQFGSLSALSMAVGNIGALTASVPLAYASSEIGWRMSFLFIAAATLVSGFLIFKFVKDYPDNYVFEDKISTKVSIKDIITNKNFIIISIMQFFWFGSFIGLQGLWGVPYLMDVFGITKSEASKIISMIAVGFIFGGPVLGFISDKILKSRKKVIIFGLSIYTVILMFMTFRNGGYSSSLYTAIFLFIGFFGSAGIMGYSHVKEHFHISQAGTVMSWVNFFSIFGAAMMQYIMGVIINLNDKTNGKYPLESYKNAFILCTVGVLISVILYFFSNDRGNHEKR